MRTIIISILLVVLAVSAAACGQSGGEQEEGRRTAEEYVKQEATYLFDSIPETLKVTAVTQIVDGWRYTIEYDSRHAGYGDRTGQVLAQVITHHAAEVAVQNGAVTSAVMDGAWDMTEQRMIEDIEISPAPIHEVDIRFMESFPVQIGVYIKAGLRDGCTTPHNISYTRDGDTISIEVTVQHPKDTACPAVYGYYEENLNLGSEFTPGVTYTVNVNDFTRTFEYPR